MSGDNHWLGDLAERHATIAPESAGMETRLLGEIARLQARIEALEAGLRSVEVNAPSVEPVKMHPTDFQARYQFWIAGKIARDLLKDSQP